MITSYENLNYSTALVITFFVTLLHIIAMDSLVDLKLLPPCKKSYNTPVHLSQNHGVDGTEYILGTWKHCYLHPHQKL